MAEPRLVRSAEREMEFLIVGRFVAVARAIEHAPETPLDHWPYVERAPWCIVFIEWEDDGVFVDVREDCDPIDGGMNEETARAVLDELPAAIELLAKKQQEAA